MTSPYRVPAERERSFARTSWKLGAACGLVGAAVGMGVGARVQWRIDRARDPEVLRHEIEQENAVREDERAHSQCERGNIDSTRMCECARQCGPSGMLSTSADGACVCQSSSRKDER